MGFRIKPALCLILTDFFRTINSIAEIMIISEKTYKPGILYKFHNFAREFSKQYYFLRL